MNKAEYGDIIEGVSLENELAKEQCATFLV
jgi:hypothetical protein